MKVKAFCNLPWQRVKVHCDGNIHMCCWQTWSFLGNLFASSFEELWFGKVAEDIRSETLQGRLHPTCQTKECPFTYREKTAKEFFVNDNGYPTELELDLHFSHCNFGGKNADLKSTCIMCPRAAPYTQENLKIIPDRTEEIVNKLKPLLPNLRNLCVMGLAEVFWQNKIFDIFDQLEFKKHQNRIHFWTNTNGSLFNKEKQDKYIDYVKNGLLQFSIDAATEETFMKIRKNPVFHRVIENVESWNNRIQELNKKPGHKYYTAIYNNINMLNVDEVPDMVRMAHKFKTRLLLHPTNNASGANYTLNEIMPNVKNHRRFAEAEENAIKLAKELGVTLEIPEPLDLGISQRYVQIKLA